MKITSIKAIYPDYQHVPPSWRTHLWQIIVQVKTDTGQEGVGYGGGGKASVEIINTHFKENLIFDFINHNYKNPRIIIINENNILDTGGGVKNAMEYFI